MLNIYFKNIKEKLARRKMEKKRKTFFVFQMAKIKISNVCFERYTKEKRT